MDTLVTAATWLFTLMSATGVVLNIRKDKRCFLVWIVANAGWIAVDIYKGILAQAALFVIYTGLSVWGWFEWSKNPPK